MVQWQPVSSSILILAENADPISEGEAGTEASSMGGKAPTGQWEAGAKVLPPLHLPHLPHDSIVTLLLSVKFQHRSVAHSIRIRFIIRKLMIPYANLRGKGAISTHLYNSDHDSMHGRSDNIPHPHNKCHRSSKRPPNRRSKIRCQLKN
jgi:hypothetical protein